MRDVLLVGGLGLLAFMLLSGKTPEDILAEVGEIPKKLTEPQRALEMTVANKDASAPETTTTPTVALVELRTGQGGISAPQQTSPYSYLQAKYPLVRAWTPEGAPVVEFYRGQDPREKAQIKAAYKEYERLKRARETGYASTQEWLAAREAEESQRTWTPTDLPVRKDVAVNAVKYPTVSGTKQMPVPPGELLIRPMTETEKKTLQNVLAGILPKDFKKSNLPSI